MSLPTVRPGDPVPNPDAAAGLQWWHVAVRMFRKPWQQKMRPMCSVMLRCPSIQQTGNGESMMLTRPGVSTEPAPEADIREGETWLIPVVVRSETHHAALTASVVRHWQRFDLPAGVARITGRRTMVDRRNYPDIPAGSHPLGLSIWYAGSMVGAWNYVLTVPEVGAGNLGFTLAHGDHHTPYRL